MPDQWYGDNRRSSQFNNRQRHGNWKIRKGYRQLSWWGAHNQRENGLKSGWRRKIQNVGGLLNVKEIEINDSEKFEFSGGHLVTPKIKGSFTNSGGTILIGEAKNNELSQPFSQMLIRPKNIGDIDNHLNIIGDYVQQYGDQVVSNLSMKIIGDKEEKWQLNVTGKAVFEGKLTVSKSDNMVFKLNQIFQIIKADSIEGSFSSYVIARVIRRFGLGYILTLHQWNIKNNKINLQKTNSHNCSLISKSSQKRQ